MTSILSCIEHDEGESRQGCCTVLLYLAKTAESRPLLLQCPGLIEVLAHVIDVKCQESSRGGDYYCCREKELSESILQRV